MDKLFIIVKGGRVEEIYSTKTETELYAEILDFDSMERTEEMEKVDLCQYSRHKNSNFYAVFLKASSSC